MKKYATMNTLYIVAAIIAVTAFVLPRGIDTVNLHIHGISHIAEQVDDYYKIAEPVDGKYTVEIDLNNLQSNEGKVLFDDGESQITVLEVVPRESAGFEVIFRSRAAEQPHGAVLVSGVDHARTDSGFSHDIEAKAEAVNKDGESYDLTPADSTGLSYHDGDRFGFFLDVSEGDADEVEVTVTNLQLNLWMEKAIFQ
ncbi:hypothetical protein DHX103_05435 [Planococcus sp. X10-3]|uniref:hypothetical protein n=1 Tax=Planococcus sp. X10-3 TaxID=3061240 RepID=UPI003BB1FE38